MLGNDKSVGTDDRIHGMRVNEDVLLKATGPPDMECRDVKKLYEIAVDVVS